MYESEEARKKAALERRMQRTEEERDLNAQSQPMPDLTRAYASSGWSYMSCPELSPIEFWNSYGCVLACTCKFSAMIQTDDPTVTEHKCAKQRTGECTLEHVTRAEFDASLRAMDPPIDPALFHWQKRQCSILGRAR